MSEDIEHLRSILEEKNAEIERLKALLRKKEEDSVASLPAVFCRHEETPPRQTSSDKLDNGSISRYSRQLILPEIGVKGQLRLQNTSVLIVGCGGLGCPAAIYLSAAGVGRLGLVDYDDVELSNLHRQILHSEARVNRSKSASAAFACSQLNSSVTCVPYQLSLDSSNALQIIKDYDIVLDATDNVATRYLLNDACVLVGKPLVSGSALRFEGQLTVYNYEDGPCYRCLFPRPPPAETVSNCSDGGVLGVVPGVIGNLQALEVIKIATQTGATYSQRLLLFDGMDGTFRTVKLRPRQSECVICGSKPTLTKLIDYEQFCGAKATDKDKPLRVLGSEERINVHEYKRLIDKCEKHVLIDVRQPGEMEICCLDNAINIPLDRLQNPDNISMLKDSVKSDKQHQRTTPVILVCRRGNDSQLGVRRLQQTLGDDGDFFVKDIKGGLTAWAKHIDKDFPVY